MTKDRTDARFSVLKGAQIEGAGFVREWRALRKGGRHAQR